MRGLIKGNSTVKIVMFSMTLKKNKNSLIIQFLQYKKLKLSYNKKEIRYKGVFL